MLFNRLLLAHSVGYRSETATARDERFVMHMVWLGRVVPDALRRAHEVVEGLIQRLPIMSVFSPQGHHFVAKVVLAWVDNVLGTALEDATFQRILAERGDTISADHFRRVFRQNPGVLRWFVLEHANSQQDVDR